MKKLIMITMAIVLISVPASAFDDEKKSYSGISTAFVNYSEPFSGLEIPVIAAVLNSGTQINELFAIEARIGRGLYEGVDGFYMDSNRYNAYMTLDNFFGIYGKVTKSFNKITAYGLLGYTRMKGTFRITQGLSSITVSDVESSFSLGLGIDVEIKNDIELGIEYTSYIEETDFNVDAISLSVKKWF